MNPYRLLEKYKNKHRVINEIKYHIDKNNLQIKPFSEFDNLVIQNIRHYSKHSKSISKSYIIQYALSNYYGWIYGNVLYYRDNTRSLELLDTIIHEYVHWIRKKQKLFLYTTSKYRFIEESIAHIIAKYITYKITRKRRQYMSMKYIECIIVKQAKMYNIPIHFARQIIKMQMSYIKHFIKV